MSAPFYKFALFGDEASLLVAFVLGIGFGFVLERAGFGSARKLTGQFYFTDMTVFKVMFTAIVTAGLGAFYLGWIGMLDLSLVYITPTYLVPMIVGGLALGVGFVTSGYCPGTSVVALSTGRIDGLMVVLGLFAGMFAFGEIFPAIEGFYTATALGERTLPGVLNLPYGVVLFGVVLMAIGGFAGAEWVERKMANREGGAAETPERARSAEEAA